MTKISKNTGKNNTSIYLINTAIDEGWIKSLALFHLLKATFGNSVIYNHRNRMPEIAQRFGISKQTLYTYFEILRDKNLIFPSPGKGNHLHLTSIKTLKNQFRDRKKCKITITPEDNLYSILCRLHIKVVERHIQKILFAIVLKRYRRQNLYKPETGEIAPVPSLSIRNTAKLLQTNERTAKKILKTGENLNVIKIQKQKPEKISSDILDTQMIEDYPGYKFTNKNGTFVQYGQKIELLEYPPKMPNISPKIFAKYCNST
ncbi:MAG: hypothetical protein R6V23_16225 [Bacteroidales bacterium]